MKSGAIKYLGELRVLARKNGKNPTIAENIFWKEIRKNEYTFLRQKSLGRYIADFYCSKLLLIIEIDGDSHDFRKYMDKERDIYFANRGIKTIRIKNETVINNNLSILIDRMIKSREREAKNWLTKEF